MSWHMCFWLKHFHNSFWWPVWLGSLNHSVAKTSAQFQRSFNLAFWHHIWPQSGPSWTSSLPFHQWLCVSEMILVTMSEWVTKLSTFPLRPVQGCGSDAAAQCDIPGPEAKWLPAPMRVSHFICPFFPGWWNPVENEWHEDTVADILSTILVRIQMIDWPL